MRAADSNETPMPICTLRRVHPATIPAPSHEPITGAEIIRVSVFRSTSTMEM